MSAKEKAFLKSTTQHYLLACMTLLLSGCFSMMARDGSYDSDFFYQKPYITDKILAIGSMAPTSATTQKTGYRLLFLGEKHSYLLTGGADQLEKLSKTSIAPRLEIDNGYATENLLIDKTKSNFWGTLHLKVDNSRGFTIQECKELNELGLAKDNSCPITPRKIYTTDIKIEGKVLAAAKISESIKQQFSHQRDISFYPAGDIPAPPNLKRIAIMPFAIIADIVTAPVQFLGLVLVSPVFLPSSSWR